METEMIMSSFVSVKEELMTYCSAASDVRVKKNLKVQQHLSYEEQPFYLTSSFWPMAFIRIITEQTLSTKYSFFKKHSLGGTNKRDF